MVIGAGGAGQTIIRSIVRNRLSGDKVVCIIDDNPNKWNRYIDGIPIVGGRDDIMYFVEKYDIDKIYIAIPSASKENKRDIINICSETNCVLKNLPDFYQYANTDINIGSLRDVSVEDLLGREPLRTDMSDVFEMIKGKTILVTGGGGSIGSELCRQIAAHQPKRLIIFDIYENNAYAIQQELREKYPEMELTVLIGSVRDSRRLEYVFKKYHPDIVYHAAAHKHVPLMEDSPCEAIKNNVVGTYKTAYAAMINNCKRFVLISTDKAVNPTNIMGASKRLCEMVIQAFDRCVKNGDMSSISTLHIHPRAAAAEPEGKLRTEFVAVRFGNVLGSNGSVVPLFPIANALKIAVLTSLKLPVWIIFPTCFSVNCSSPSSAPSFRSRVRSQRRFLMPSLPFSISASLSKPPNLSCISSMTFRENSKCRSLSRTIGKRPSLIALITK